MKKIFVLLTSILLLAAITVTASAATGMTASNAVGKAGQTVELTFTIDGSVKGDQILVEYSYDKSILTIQTNAGQCRWHPDGFGDFERFKPNIGTWAPTSTGSVDIQGALFTLVFYINNGVSFDTTSVKCTVRVSNDGKIAGEYTATGKVSTTCIHSYGPWESTGEFNHERSCTICGEKQTGVHSWNEGKQIADPTNANDSLMVFTCTGCTATKELPMAGVHTPQPQPEPTVQPSEPDHGYTHPTKPTEPEEFQNPTFGTAPEPERDPFTGELVNKEEPTAPTQSFVDYNEPEHTHVETTAPMYIEHDHDHTTEATEQERSARGALVLSIGIIFVVVLVYVVKKKS